MEKITPRERVNLALDHKTPDRNPVDFLAVPEIWEGLIKLEGLQPREDDSTLYFDPLWEQLLRKYQVDCRVVSYDQFCQPPESFLLPDANIDWFGALSRSTPNRMWRQVTPDGHIYDIWGRHFRTVDNQSGAYEELSSFPLSEAGSIDDLSNYEWPEPDWWDFSDVPQLLDQLDSEQENHIRYRAGSVFEIAWQLCGMDTFLMDLAINPQMPVYIMERLTEVYVEITQRFLVAAGDRVDIVYFYDDVATQNSLMISKKMWEQFIRPHHAKIVETAKKFNKKVMYHCDGASYSLIPDLIDLGIDVLNPVQADAKDMAPDKLKAEFGDRLVFHGGIDIIKTLPNGSPAEVQEEVKTRISQLGSNGGYIMASSHHIQADTPLENARVMYDLAIR